MTKQVFVFSQCVEMGFTRTFIGKRIAAADFGSQR